MKLSRSFLFVLITSILLNLATAQPTLPNLTRQGSSNPATSNHLLIITALQDDPALVALENELNLRGKSYKVHIATKEVLSEDNLVDPTGKGLYSAVILTEGGLSYFDGNNWRSAFSSQEWQRLWNYQQSFNVKQLSLYTYPTNSPEDYGLRLVEAIDTSLQSHTVQVTAQGKELLPQVPESFELKQAYTYLSKLEPVDGMISTPLISDAAGNVLAVHSVLDGRERIALTMSQNAEAVHTQLLLGSLFDWLVPVAPIVSTSTSTATQGSYTIEYFLLLVGMIILAVLLANWLLKRQRAKRHMSRQPNIQIID